jgi:hypothetical protein
MKLYTEFLNLNILKKLYKRTQMTGKVYIASMNLRGEWAERPHEKCILLNVTSAQGKTHKNRLQFSPMTEIPGGYKGFWNFESYWQSLKVFEDIPHEITKKWWLNLKEPKRRYPKSKGKIVSYSKVDHIEEKLDYISSRKRVYVPEYYNLIKDRDQLKVYKEFLKNGNDVVVYDFDGPRKPNRDVDCKEVTIELLKEKLNDLQFPYGHGYIVAGLLLDILPEKYI